MAVSRSDAPYELRRNADGTPDDLVFGDPKKGVFCHIEQMGEDHWWIGVTIGPGKVIMINLHSDSPIECIAEEDW